MTSNGNNRFDPFAPSPKGPTHNEKSTHANNSMPLSRLDSNQVQYLQQQGFSSGLTRVFAEHSAKTPLRIWILDNSRYMTTRDAHRIVGGTHDNLQNSTEGTRWEELQDCVAYHAQAAVVLPLPIRFALVNPNPNLGPAVFGVGESGAPVAAEVQRLQQIMTNTRLSGPNPLARHLKSIHQYVVSVAPQLRQAHQTATIVLATQGLPTDQQGNSSPAVVQEFIKCLRAFESLPVWIVVRLCTDDESVFDFYNSLDANLVNLGYDVLDDYFGEAMEVYLRNPWLTYGLPLHRMREMGFSLALLDALDEHLFSLQQVGEFINLILFGQGQGKLPDPCRDLNAFLRAVSQAMAKEKSQWNPITKSVTPWFNLDMIHAIYSKPAAVHPPRPTTSQQQQQQPFPRQPPQQQQSHPSHPGANHPGANPPPPQQQTQPPTVQNVPSNPPSTAVIKVEDLKRHILMGWALQPPAYRTLKPIQQLLASVEQTFPPAFGIEPHQYFDKHKPFSLNALMPCANEAVLKRAVKKFKFFLHPDKLPRDLTEKQKLLCQMLWDVTADAWEIHNNLSQ